MFGKFFLESILETQDSETTNDASANDHEFTIMDDESIEEIKIDELQHEIDVQDSSLPIDVVDNFEK